MKRNKWFWAGWTALCMACLMSACGGKEEKKVSLGNSKGLPGELLLIVDPSLWKTDARDSLEGVFKGSVPALPQHEPMFRMMRIFPENYSAKFSTLRNIVEVREDPKVENVEMGVAYNVKAAPQVYVSIKAHDAAALNCFLSEYRERLTGYFVEGELRWEGALLKKKYSAMVDKASREIFGWSVKTPSGIRSMKRAEDFLWASTDLPDQDMNYVCYALPLADSARMLTERWVELRDSVMKRNIPGAKPENWMTTTYENGRWWCGAAWCCPTGARHTRCAACGRCAAGRWADLLSRWPFPTRSTAACWWRKGSSIHPSRRSATWCAVWKRPCERWRRCVDRPLPFRSARRLVQ